MSLFQIAYTVLGGLGIFFYGMKTMSDSLQAMAGEVIKRIINSLTSNRFFAVLVGTAVTTIVQSSSVTTVMVVGFVNAGLMELTQAIGVILGANIGTTITGWIISIKIGKYGLLFIGLGIIPALFGNNEKLKGLGKVLFGIGMIFFGLEIMSNAFKPLRSHDEFLNAISYFNGSTYGHYFASIITGCFLTVVIQSSSAMLGITIALALSGIINFNTAAALVMGENIGTTITAILASIGANTNAKRAAYAHSVFNVLGVVVLFSVFPYYLELVENLIPGLANFTNSQGDRPFIASHIAAAHSIFNVANSLLFIPLLPMLKNLVVYLAPDKEEKETDKFIMIGNAKDIVPATAIVQAQSELVKFKEILERMYHTTHKYLSLESAKEEKKVYQKIIDYENICDNIQKEITVFLCHTMEKEMVVGQSKQIQSLIRVADEIESVADYLTSIATYKKRLKEERLSAELLKEFTGFMEEVWSFFMHCFSGIEGDVSVDIAKIETMSNTLKDLANGIRDKHLERIGKKAYSPVSALTYSDMIVSLRKMRAHAQNIAENSVILSTNHEQS
ncbi:Na/Pi cotransporter family protein [Bacteriovoracaceae bacterium]|nr:Na/Pi cotransporter family protein [Bacteriovoracaceae bacterium]